MKTNQLRWQSHQIVHRAESYAYRCWRATANRFPRIELLAAVAVAGWYFRKQHGLAACLWQVRHLGKALFQRAKVARELTEARLMHCRACPLFYAPLSTCGTPWRKSAQQWGCWCHMPTKARLLENCWQYDQSGRTPMYAFIGWGWPVELNSWPFES